MRIQCESSHSDVMLMLKRCNRRSSADDRRNKSPSCRWCVDVTMDFRTRSNAHCAAQKRSSIKWANRKMCLECCAGKYYEFVLDFFASVPTTRFRPRVAQMLPFIRKPFYFQNFTFLAFRIHLFIRRRRCRAHLRISSWFGTSRCSCTPFCFILSVQFELFSTASAPAAPVAVVVVTLS